MSSLSNSARPEELDEDEPEAALGLELEEDEEGEDDDEGDEDEEDDGVLLCDMDGEEDEPELLFESPAAYPAAAKASSEKLRAMGLINFMGNISV